MPIGIIIYKKNEESWRRLRTYVLRSTYGFIRDRYVLCAREGDTHFRWSRSRNKIRERDSYRVLSVRIYVLRTTRGRTLRYVAIAKRMLRSILRRRRSHGIPPAYVIVWKSFFSIEIKTGGRFHKILGIDVNADQSEIKRAFRERALRYHPDKPGGSTVRFQALREAYEALSSSEDLKVEDSLLEDLKESVHHKDYARAWCAWDSMIDRGMPVDIDAFSWIFRAERDFGRGSERDVLAELRRAREANLMNEGIVEATVYNMYLSTLANRGKCGIDRAMDLLNRMDELALDVDQSVAQRVFTYFSGVS